MIKVPPTGPCPARIMIVGEAPGADEVKAMQPFVGASGRELDKMLSEAGIIRADCFITNVCKRRPPANDITNFLLSTKAKGRIAGYPERFGLFMSPEIVEGLLELQKEIKACKPNVIIALGNTPLWALTGQRGIGTWRGSLMQSLPEYGSVKVIPVYHPAAILRMWAWRAVAVNDLRRAESQAHNPLMPVVERNFYIRPSFEETMSHLREMLRRCEIAPTPLAVDIETIGQRHISCIGIAWSHMDALCIPFTCEASDEGYWSLEEETQILFTLKDLLEHPNCQCIGQNFHYDCQYMIRNWGIWPNTFFDTMWAHHLCWPGTPKSLDYIASMYCVNYTFWKEESKGKNPNATEEEDWIYNCKDCVATFECFENLSQSIEKLGLQQPWQIQMSLFNPILKMMLRGVRINMKIKGSFALELLEAIAPREQFLLDCIGEYVGVKKPTKNTAQWFKSPKQIAALFYDEMQLPVQKHKKTHKPTTDDEALRKLELKEVLVAPLTDAITELRSLYVFLNNFIETGIDHDNRLRCSFKVAGTETFRLASSEDVFGFGTNLQNIPSGNEEQD